MEKYFECFNCKDLMGTVYESKCCGVLYCQNCEIKLSNTQCLKCNKSLEFQKNIFVQRLFKNINVKCKYGCGVSLPYDKMKQHLLICDKKIYICSFDKINNDNLDKQPFKGNKKEILDHLVKEHSHILLLFMENHQNFEPILKLIKKNYNNNDQYKEDTILDLTNSGNFNLDFFRNNDIDGGTSIDLDQDIRLLNGINNSNTINSNLQNFNDLQINNYNRRRNNHNSHNNHNNRNHQNRNNNNDIIINERINSLNSENSDNENDNEDENINLNNNINLLDVDLSRNHYQPLRELRFNSLFNENANNINLDYRFNIDNNNNNSEHNSNHINGHINNTRNRRRIGNLLNSNQNNYNNLNSNINSNTINNGGNNINSQNSNNF